jgi:hypothetical protein
MIAYPTAPSPNPPRLFVAEVRYSLPDLLEEIKAERATSTFAMEKLDQHEIGKLFKAKAPRAKGKKS